MRKVKKIIEVCAKETKHSFFKQKQQKSDFQEINIFYTVYLESFRFLGATKSSMQA